MVPETSKQDCNLANPSGQVLMVRHDVHQETTSPLALIADNGARVDGEASGF